METTDPKAASSSRCRTKRCSFSEGSPPSRPRPPRANFWHNDPGRRWLCCHLSHRQAPQARRRAHRRHSYQPPPRRLAPLSSLHLWSRHLIASLTSADPSPVPRLPTTNAHYRPQPSQRGRTPLRELSGSLSRAQPACLCTYYQPPHAQTSACRKPFDLYTFADIRMQFHP